MIKINHKFGNYNNNFTIETLILGTFNPDTEQNNAEFYYGRQHNFLWNLLPRVFGYKTLKNSSLSEKIEFINNLKIGFSDLIEEIQIEEGNETNYEDEFIDKKVTKWNDLEFIISKCENLKSIYFTRKSFSGIPNIRKQIENLKIICQEKKIDFNLLPTPARFENEKKLNDWKTIFKK